VSASPRHRVSEISGDVALAAQFLTGSRKPFRHVRLHELISISLVVYLFVIKGDFRILTGNYATISGKIA
jgi:hypothetical protein